MKKKIAIPTQKGKLSKGISKDTMFSFFELENEKVVSAELESVPRENTDSTSLWLHYKNVTHIYLEEISGELKRSLNALGIVVKTKNELTDDIFFNRFVFDPR